MLEGYSEEGGQEVHQGSGPHSTQQPHQMVSVRGRFYAGQLPPPHTRAGVLGWDVLKPEPQLFSFFFSFFYCHTVFLFTLKKPAKK